MAVAITRSELSAMQLRGRRRARETPRRRAGCWRWRSCWRGAAGRRRRRVAGWTDRRCGEKEQKTVQWTVFPTDGFIATMRRGWRVSPTAPSRGVHPCSMPRRCARLRRSSRRDRILRRTGSCAGGGVTCAASWSGASACGLRSGRWARSCADSASPACPRGPATPRATRKRRRYIKLRRRGARGVARGGAGQAGRGVVPG